MQNINNYTDNITDLNSNSASVWSARRQQSTNRSPASPSTKAQKSQQPCAGAQLPPLHTSPSPYFARAKFSDHSHTT